MITSTSTIRKRNLSPKQTILTEAKVIPESPAKCVVTLLDRVKDNIHNKRKLSQNLSFLVEMLFTIFSSSVEETR